MIWQPNPGPQTKALQSSAYETLYGGARGGGKTDAGLVWMIKPYLINNPHYKGLVIRETSKDLIDWTDRAREMYHSLGAVFAGNPPIIKFPSGARIRTGHLGDDNAYTQYQGHEYQRMLIEELTQIPSERRYVQLIGSCRSTVPGIDARVFATTNPGNKGHVWVKERFVDPSIWGDVFIAPDTSRTRVFIPAKLEDNPILMQADPDYEQYLNGIKLVDEELYKAWRHGDWNVFAGKYFREFDRRLHVIRPFQPDYTNKNLSFVGGLDWGRTAPFACIFTLIMKVTYNEVTFNRAITYKMTYGTNKNPRDWATIIAALVPLDKIEWIQADNQIFAPGNDGSVDIAQQFANANEKFTALLKPSVKDRIGGWQNLHNWLSIAPDGLPYWLITEDCVDLIRELPNLIHDTINVEDIMQDVDIDDHASDAIRYQFMKVQWIDARLGRVNTAGRAALTKIRARQVGAPTRIDPEKFMAQPKMTAGWQEI